MNTFFTSDQHFNHEPVIGYTGRPFSTVDDMNEYIIEQYNSVVKENDHVYHIGDFAWSMHSTFARRLNGVKTLLVGNHDKMNVEGLSAFNYVHDMVRTKINGIRIIMCHFPMMSWWNCGGSAWMLHGHTHKIELTCRKRLYVGVDGRRDFKPWSFEEVKEVMDELPRY